MGAQDWQGIIALAIILVGCGWMRWLDMNNKRKEDRKRDSG